MLKNEIVQSSIQGVSPEKISKMEEKNRKTGIDVMGDAPFGTHFCLFYQTKEDLIDVLVPYFKAGLESNEFCMWVTSEPLCEEEAKEAMRRAVPDFDGYLERGQIEIVPHTEWYLKGGAFNLQRVLNGWVEKLSQALAKGYDGMRVTGNTGWLEKRDWKNFADYEQEVNDVIGKYRMIVICTYSLDKCGASEVIDVVRNHQFAVIKREGKWELIESAKLKRAREALRESEEKFRSIFKSANDCMTYLDRFGRILEVNEKAVEVFGGSKEELLGKHFTRVGVLSPIDIPTAMSAFAKILASKKATVNTCIKNKKGREIHVEVSASLMKMNGKFAGMLVIARDVTERKKMEEALGESEEKHRNLLENARDTIMALDLNGNITFVNRVIEEYGFKKDEIIGKNMAEFVPEKYHQKLIKEFAKVIQGNSAEGEIEIITPKGKIISEYRSSPIRRGNKVIGSQTILRDITERKKMEEKLKQYSEHLEELVQKRTEELLESEKRYSVLVEEAGDGVAIAQAEKIAFANKRLIEIVGYSRDELIGLPFENLLDEKYHKYVKGRFEQMLRPEAVAAAGCFEIEAITKTSERVPVELCITRIQSQGRPAVLAIIRDTRERKRIEEQRSKLEKLATIGELATMVGHDLRNPLQSIENAAYYLNNELSLLAPTLPNPQETMEMLQAINNSVNYAAKIIRDLQDFSATKTPILKKANINNIVRDTLQQTQTPNNVELRTEMRSLPEIEVDEDQIKRVFMNFVANGIQAMENGGGTITVSTKQTEGFVEITFKDIGEGISKENLSKVFTPLFTTKAKGMGMGLPICKKFVESHGGSIEVESKVGKGTTCTVKLPILQDNGGEKT